MPSQSVQRVLEGQDERPQDEDRVERAAPGRRTASRPTPTCGAPPVGGAPRRRRSGSRRGSGEPRTSDVVEPRHRLSSRPGSRSRPAPPSAVPPGSAARRPASAAAASSSWRRWRPVALAMKSIAPLSSPIFAPAVERARGDRARLHGRHVRVGRTHRVRAADLARAISRALLVGGHPVEEERGAVGVLGLRADPEGQRRRHRRLLAALLRRRHQEEADVARHLLVEVARLPVAVEHEQALAADEPAHHLRVVDRVDVLGEVAGLDPLLQVLRGLQVRRRVDRGARLLEDPVVDRAAAVRRRP